MKFVSFFRDVILGHSHIDTLQRDHAVSADERVGEKRTDKRDTVLPSATSEKDPVHNRGRITWADVPVSQE
jgi:hypothetical protein